MTLFDNSVFEWLAHELKVIFDFGETYNKQQLINCTGNFTSYEDYSR